MTQQVQSELKAAFQCVLAIFISFTLLRFLAVFAVNYSILPAIGVLLGAGIIYLCIRKTHEFDLFVGIACLLAIPFSVMFHFVM